MTTLEKVLTSASDCCGAELIEAFRDNPRDHHDPIAIYQCSKCECECDEVAVCDFCRGSGQIENLEWSEDGKCYMPGGEMRKCVCRIDQEFDADDDS